MYHSSHELTVDDDERDIIKPIFKKNFRFACLRVINKNDVLPVDDVISILYYHIQHSVISSCFFTSGK